MILELILLLFFHILDMLFTVLYLKKAEKDFQNVHELEVNFHKYFFKKYGLVQGALRSLMISLTLFFIAWVFLVIWNKTWAIYFLLGMIFSVAYVNYIQYISYDIAKELKKHKVDKNEKNR